MIINVVPYVLKIYIIFDPKLLKLVTVRVLYLKICKFVER